MNPLITRILLGSAQLAATWFIAQLVKSHVITDAQSAGMLSWLLHYAEQYAPLVGMMLLGAWTHRKDFRKYIAGRMLSGTASDAAVTALAQRPIVTDMAFKSTEHIEQRVGSFVGSGNY
jgi:hypothetical protein